MRADGICSRSGNQWFRSSTKTNALFSLAQVDFGQIVLLHELDQPANFLDVENVAAAGRGI
jgi:hypothetical protein